MAAATLDILRKSQNQCLVKVTGLAGDTVTISLATDLVVDNEEVTLSDTPFVTINAITWCGDNANHVEVVRGTTPIATLACAAASQLPFEQAHGVDNVAATEDITVSFSGSGTLANMCWLTLKKVTGYSQKFEPAIFGGYDDPTKVGE